MGLPVELKSAKVISLTRHCWPTQHSVWSGSIYHLFISFQMHGQVVKLISSYCIAGMVRSSGIAVVSLNAVLKLMVHHSFFLCLPQNLPAKTFIHFVLVSVVLPGVELWYDCILSTHDMEGSYGSDRQWEPYCCCTQVCLSYLPVTFMERRKKNERKRENKTLLQISFFFVFFFFVFFFSPKVSIFFLFLHVNICCGYLLEQHMFLWINISM